MAVQLSVAERNARLNTIPTTAGASAILRIYTGTQPATCATATSGTQLVTMTLPATYFAAAASGAMAFTGTWTGTAAATGTAGYFRIWDNAVANCHAQGSVTVTGSGGDLTTASTTITSGDTVNVTGFTLTDANA